jgi:hypothetical protein
MNKKSDEKFSEHETASRRDAIIKRMLATPPQPHSEMKLRKSRRKAGTRPKDATAQLKKSAKNKAV